MIRLTDKEVEKLLDEWPIGADGAIRMGAEAQLKKLAEWIKNRPTDGWDKWHFYNKDLAEAILKEAEDD